MEELTKLSSFTAHKKPKMASNSSLDMESVMYRFITVEKNGKLKYNTTVLNRP